MYDFRHVAKNRKCRERERERERAGERERDGERERSKYPFMCADDGGPVRHRVDACVKTATLGAASFSHAPYAQTDSRCL